MGTSHQIASTVTDVQKTARDAVQIASFPTRRLAGMWGLVLRAAGGSKGSALQWLAAPVMTRLIPREIRKAQAENLHKLKELLEGDRPGLEAPPADEPAVPR